MAIKYNKNVQIMDLGTHTIKFGVFKITKEEEESGGMCLVWGSQVSGNQTDYGPWMYTTQHMQRHNDGGTLLPGGPSKIAARPIGINLGGTHQAMAHPDYSSNDFMKFTNRGFVLGNAFHNVASQHSWTFRRRTRFFDQVLVTGNGVNNSGQTASNQVTHNLGVKPEMIIIKATDNSAYGLNWEVWHTGLLGSIANLADDSAAANGLSDSATADGVRFRYHSTASVIGRTNSSHTNSSSHSYIGLLFASLSGISAVNKYTGTGNDKSYMVVPVSADRGLCGGFNSSINRETFKLVKSLEKDGKNVQLMPVGKKSRDFFNRVMKEQIVESFIDLNVSNNGYDSALNISNKLQDLYFEGKFDKCILVFNKFKNSRNERIAASN